MNGVVILGYKLVFIKVGEEVRIMFLVLNWVVYNCMVSFVNVEVKLSKLREGFELCIKIS